MFMIEFMIEMTTSEPITDENIRQFRSMGLDEDEVAIRRLGSKVIFNIKRLAPDSENAMFRACREIRQVIDDEGFTIVNGSVAMIHNARPIVKSRLQ